MSTNKHTYLNVQQLKQYCVVFAAFGKIVLWIVSNILSANTRISTMLTGILYKATAWRTGKVSAFFLSHRGICRWNELRPCRCAENKGELFVYWELKEPCECSGNHRKPKKPQKQTKPKPKPNKPKPAKQLYYKKNWHHNFLGKESVFSKD